jgi:DNA repair exonuclease SbcCD ATPase subunit
MIASLKGYGRIARTVLAVIAAFLVLGIVGSLVMSVRATNAARTQVVDQATAIADSSLTLAFAPDDLGAPVSSERAFELTEQIQAIVIDPSDFDSVTLLSPEGTILYSTATSRIATELPGEQERIKGALKGEPQTQDIDGVYSVMLPLRFPSGVGGPAVVELARSNTPIASAAGPWRTNAAFLFAMLVLLGVAVFGVARVLQVVAQGGGPSLEVPRHPQASPHVTPTRAVSIPQPGIREEGEARRRAEDRATSAEERLAVLQDQYRRALEELQRFQHLAREPQAANDPELERRARRTEDELHELRQRLQVFTEERQHHAAELERAASERAALVAELEAARAGTGGAERDRRIAASEQVAMALRAELETSKHELDAARGEIRELRARAETSETGATNGSDASRRELLRVRDELASSQGQLASATTELDELRTELRALRAEEQRAAMLEDELRTTKAELDSFRASHRADLVEREAEFEEKVRATREEFQRQLADIEASYRSQVGQREADLAGRIAQAEAAAREADRDLEATRTDAEAARAEAAAREARLLQATDEIAAQRDRIAALDAEVKERTLAVSQARKENEDLRRSLVALQADLAQTDGSVETIRAELENERAKAAEIETAAETADRDRRSLVERVERLTKMLEEAVNENAELNRRLQDFEARRQLELADDPGRSEIDELLRVTQERLAGQTEKLIAAEDRVKELETQTEEARERLEVIEGELRTHQMSEALREMREHPAGDGEGASRPEGPVEDRRATSPFMKELSNDAKKSLTRILGITQILKHKKDGKEHAQLLKQLNAYAKRLDATVADLADAERLVRGTIELQPRRIDLEALVQRVVDESDIASEREIHVAVQPVQIRIDPQRTEQILTGMLRVSGDRTPASKDLAVRLQPAQGGALLSVEDPEPSSDASMSPVVRRLAEILGGWAKVDSRDGGGSVFRVFLPDGDHQAAEAADQDEPALPIVIAETAPPLDDWEPAAAERILSQELRRLAELEER